MNNGFSSIDSSPAVIAPSMFMAVSDTMAPRAIRAEYLPRVEN